MQIVYRNTAELIPYANNPRNNDKAVDAVAASIREFGFKIPIIVDPDGVIVAGHTRLKAAQKLGLESVPVIVADDLTEDQVKAFRLADNKTAELAEWDFDLLGDELDGIFDIDMSDFGFSESISSFDETALNELFADAPEKEKKPKKQKRKINNKNKWREDYKRYNLL